MAMLYSHKILNLSIYKIFLDIQSYEVFTRLKAISTVGNYNTFRGNIEQNSYVTNCTCHCEHHCVEMEVTINEWLKWQDKWWILPLQNLMATSHGD